MSRKMLIVDDDPPILALLADIGRSCGYDVETTDSAYNLVDHIIELQPEFIILDLVMPKFDGIEVLRGLSDASVEARILLISGFDPDLLNRAHMLARACKLNVVDTMEKPLDPAAVADRIKAAGAEPKIQDKW